jgi:hypothetical protein
VDEGKDNLNEWDAKMEKPPKHRLIQRAQQGTVWGGINKPKN